MGTVSEVIKMEKNQEEMAKRQKEIEKIEKQKEHIKLAEKEEKQYNKDLLKAYEKDLQMIFNNYFEKERLTESIYYFTIKRNTR